MKKVIVLLCLIIALLPSVIAGYLPSNYTLEDYSYMKEIEILLPSTPTLNLTDYPAIFTINTSELISSGKMKNDCSDILITDDTEKKLSYEVTNCNNPDFNTTIYVKIPSLSDSVGIYLFYGSPGKTSQENVTDTWSNGFIAVYHFDYSNYTNNGLFFFNSSINNNIFQLTNRSTETYWNWSADAKYGGGFNASGGYGLKTISPMQLNSSSYISTWFKTSDPFALTGLFYQESGTGYSILVGENERIDFPGDGGSGSGVDVRIGSFKLIGMGVTNGDNFEVLVTGTQRTTRTGGGLPNSEFHISPYSENYVIDEFRISNNSRSSDWQNAEVGQYSIFMEEQIVEKSSPFVKINFPLNNYKYLNISYFNVSYLNVTMIGNITNISSFENFSCYQEDATISNYCGGKSTGNYTLVHQSGFTNRTFTYTLPDNFINGTWKIKIISTGGYPIVSINNTHNYSISDCKKDSNVTLYSQMSNTANCEGVLPGKCILIYCLNDTNEKVIFRNSSYGGSGGYIYTLNDEDMVWINNQFTGYSTNSLTEYIFDINPSYGQNNYSIYANTNFNTQNSSNVSFVLVNSSIEYNSIETSLSQTRASLTIKKASGLVEYSDINISLLYNGSVINPVKTSDINNIYFNFTYTTPLITSNSIVPLNFYFNFSSTPTFNYSYSQVVQPIDLKDCSTNETGKYSLNISFFEEETLSSSVNVSTNLEISVNNTNQVFGLELRNRNNYSICLNSENSLVINSKIEYYGENYSNRKYYLNNYVLDNETDNINLYTINSDLASDIILTVYDKSKGTRVKDAYVKILRYYPGKSNVSDAGYSTIEIEKTDALGQTGAKLYLADVWYKFIVEYPSSVIKYNGDVEKVLTTDKLLPISLSTNNLLKYNNLAQVNGDVSCVKSSQTCTFTWSDPTGIAVRGELKVFEDTGYTRRLVYSNSLETAAGTIAYVIPNITNKVFVAEGVIYTNE